VKRAWWDEREDGRCGTRLVITEERSGSDDAVLVFHCGIRLPWHRARRLQLLIRAYHASDEVTLSLGRDDD
jgi:hypothetical protein